MSISSGPMTTPEARGCIYACLGAEDPAAAVQDMLGDITQVTDPDILKIAQYALLMPPVTDGVRTYLEDPFEASVAEIPTVSMMHAGIAKKSAERVVEAVASNPNSGLAARINQRRAEVLEHRGELTAPIDGLFSAIPQAAGSATMTTTRAAYLIAAKLQTSGEYQDASREEFIEGVKASGSLTRASARLHLAQSRVTHWAMELMTDQILRGDETAWPNADNLEVRDGTAKLTTDLQEWLTPSDKQGAHYRHNGARNLRDVRVGCLLSFAPELVTEYYRQHVDLLEKHNFWPDQLQAG